MTGNHRIKHLNFVGRPSEVRSVYAQCVKVFQRLHAKAELAILRMTSIIFLKRILFDSFARLYLTPVGVFTEHAFLRLNKATKRNRMEQNVGVWRRVCVQNPAVLMRIKLNASKLSKSACFHRSSLKTRCSQISVGVFDHKPIWELHWALGLDSSMTRPPYWKGQDYLLTHGSERVSWLKSALHLVACLTTHIISEFL